MRLALILALLQFCASANTGDYWFKTGQAVKDAPVVYVDVVTCGEHENALGCFLEMWAGHAGVIVVKNGLRSSSSVASYRTRSGTLQGTDTR